MTVCKQNLIIDMHLGHYPLGRLPFPGANERDQNVLALVKQLRFPSLITASSAIRENIETLFDAIDNVAFRRVPRSILEDFGG